jgi:hypothetical protein
MRAIWSLWSKALYGRGSGWLSEKHHLCAWVLSVETAKKHYPRTALFTDDEGAATLIEQLDLRFETVSTNLNALRGCDPDWWALGKVFAYASQAEPFAHIDTDVFLWNRLPELIERADVFAQNPEYLANDGWPALRDFETAIRNISGWIPHELITNMRRYPYQKGANCGVFGGCRIDFIKHYARTA